MANQATAGNTVSQNFGAISGPFGPTPQLPPFTALFVPSGIVTGPAPPPLYGGPATLLATILEPDNARANASAKGALGGLHPINFP